MQVTIAALLTFALAANGEEIVGTSLSEVVPVSGSSILASFPFGTPGCYPTGSAMGTKGQTITVSRTGTHTCNVAALGAAPQLVTCQANEACVEAGGLLVEPARTNGVLDSENLASTAWSDGGGGPCTLAVNQGPSGFTDLDKLTCSTGVNTNRYATATFTSTAGPVTASATLAADAGTRVLAIIWYANGSPGSSCSCWRLDGGACVVEGLGTATPSAYGTFATTPTRMAITCTPGAAQTSFNISLRDGRWGQANSGGGLFGRAQIEVGAYATSYIPTVGTSAARSADAVSITNPLAATNPASWCVEGTVTPEGGRAWGAGGNAWMWSAGSGTANTASGYETASVIAFDVWDGSSVRRQATASLPAAGARRIQFENVAGTLTVIVDGVRGTPVSSGGTGTLTQPATMYLGSNAGASQGGNYAQNFKVSKGVCR